MRKIYEAIGKEKRDLIEADNEIRAFERQLYQKDEIGIEDCIMIGRIDIFPIDSKVDIHWTLNGLINDNENLKEIVIIEPLKEQVNNMNLLKLNAVDTTFKWPIELSEKAIILMPISKYEELCRDEKVKNTMDYMNIRLYEGEEELAVKMIFLDKNYIYLDMKKNGYLLDNSDTKKYIEILLERQNQIEENWSRGQKIKKLTISKKLKNQRVIRNIDKDGNSKVITGLTLKKEGNIELDRELQASTSIGKARENQEDAILLIRDKMIPKFRMIVVADGMGGWQNGNVASDIIVSKLKEWFENLSQEEKDCYYTGVEGFKDSLQEKIELDIQVSVEAKTYNMGGSTLVCAIIGENDTLVANIGDSRAYIIKDGKLQQISREDTIAQENLKKGKTPTKEASRFDKEANILTQCIGMDRRELKHPHFQILKNTEYDMLLLFSDGITDCLSEDDIAVICKNSDRKEVAKTLVEKANRHDSIEPEEFENYEHLKDYIPGGKDNATAAVYIQKKDEEIDR